MTPTRVPGTQKGLNKYYPCVSSLFYDDSILVLALLQDANEGGGKLSQPEGSGEACQRGKSELVQKMESIVDP